MENKIKIPQADEMSKSESEKIESTEITLQEYGEQEAKKINIEKSPIKLVGRVYKEGESSFVTLDIKNLSWGNGDTIYLDEGKKEKLNIKDFVKWDGSIDANYYKFPNIRSFGHGACAMLWKGEIENCPYLTKQQMDEFTGFGAEIEVEIYLKEKE